MTIYQFILGQFIKEIKEEINNSNANSSISIMNIESTILKQVLLD